MFVSYVSDFLFVGKVEPYFLSAGEEVLVTFSEKPTVFEILPKKFGLGVFSKKKDKKKGQKGGQKWKNTEKRGKKWKNTHTQKREK